jgi:hypothetical protein
VHHDQQQARRLTQHNEQAKKPQSHALKHKHAYKHA